MKKQTKSSKARSVKTTAPKQVIVVHSRRQRILGVLGLVALFACGVMFGMDLQNKHAPKVGVNPVTEEKNIPACEVVEKALLSVVLPDGEVNWNDPEHNVKTYTRLVQHGCPENREKYEKMIVREQEILKGLINDYSENIKNCQKIENLLNNRIYDTYSSRPDDHIEYAKIYANLSERGCPENHQKYVDLAKQELEIARALEDDQMNQRETIEVVETYKRIQMQQAAQEILDKAKKIANPAIDFIIELEKIINE